MSTNAIVGIPTGTGFTGRYVHWDGYPAGVGRAVANIVKRDGTELAVKTLTEDYTEWSQVTGDDDPASTGPIIVKGYGIAYDDQDETYWYDENSRGPEWAYAITTESIVVWRWSGAAWTRSPGDDIAL